MSTKKALQELGLTDQESAVYLSLLKSGGAMASTVARDIGIKRTTVYAILKTMAQKGFITTYYRKSRQLFYAEKPARVADYFSKKVASFVEVIPALESLEKKQLKITGLRSIETVAELEKFYEQILVEYKNKEYRAIGNATAWQGLDPEFFIEYRKRRAAANIKTKILITEESKESSPTDSSLKREVKLLPEKHTFKSTIDIFNDKILIVSPELSSLAIVIAVPAMVDVFQCMFDMLWETAE
jgi:sugar-specific transcriptional regulator TrmB